LRQIPAHHLSIAWYDAARDYAAQPESLPDPVKTGVASKFITMGVPNASLLSALVAREAPCVHIGQDAGVAGITSVVPEYARASRMAVDALLALGHQRIAILSGPFGSTDPVIIELNYGVRAAYDALKIPIEAQNVIYGNPTFEHGVASADLLLDRAQKPTAVFCFSPLAAAGVMHRAQERGLKVPGDLSVIGFGEADFCPLLHPPLTTVSLPVEETARQTLADLLERIKTQDYAATRRLTLPSGLIERHSLSAPGEEGSQPL
jgi:DNA-binding LacI/PurR family transcriptional regulator